MPFLPLVNRTRGSLIFLGIVVLIVIAALVTFENPAPLLPPLVALALLALTSSAGWSLLIASLVGVLLLRQGPLWQLPFDFVSRHFWPSLKSPWHWSALVFTLMLAAFAAIVERSGALGALLQKWSQSKPREAASRLQTSLVTLGLICFFDGLANALMLGRVGRTLADQAGVSRQKLAYLVDTTSSAVACVAFLSTWSVFQLSLIAEALADSPFSEPAYLLFLRSIPQNFYCLGSLLLVFLAARWNWNPPPMRAARPHQVEAASAPPALAHPLRTAFGPVVVLVLSVPLAFWILGGGKWLPTQLSDIQTAFSTYLGPYALLLAGGFALVGALAFFPGKKTEGLRAIPSGMRSIAPALVILVLAWTLGSTLSALETGKFLASLLGDSFPLTFLPLATFALACAIAFCTGTSWGTMGILMPLSLGTFLSMMSEQNLPPESLAYLIPALIAAVFGGAVFGDHASPFSDTTIVSALACDISTSSHVATQLPYALLAAGSALLFGYLPLGLGFNSPLIAMLPLIAIFLTVVGTRKNFSPPDSISE